MLQKTECDPVCRPRPRYAATIESFLPSQGQQISLGDSSLPQLGQELDRLIAEWLPLKKEAERLDDICRALTEREDGKDYSSRCSVGLDSESAERYFRFQRENGADKAINAEIAASERIDAVNRQIRSIKPTTLAGLAVWAKATRCDCLTIEAQELPIHDTDWDDQCLIQFLAEVERMAGEQP